MKQTAAERSPISVGKTVAFGLLFPGAAQVYGGRWGLAMAFLLMPWILTLSCLILSIGVGMGSMIFPQIHDPAMRGIGFLLNGSYISNGKILPILWVTSIIEGARWAQSERERPSGRTVSWKRPVIGLGLIVTLVIPFFLLQFQVLKIVLVIGHAVKDGFKALLGKP